MKRVKAYNANKLNSKFVSGMGYVAGKPAIDLKKGDTVLTLGGKQKKVLGIESITDRSVSVRLDNGKLKRYLKKTIVPIAWDESGIDEAAAYGHRV